nr:MAG TPA: hypothetical protein [Caudoviricetes sp.]
MIFSNQTHHDLLFNKPIGLSYFILSFSVMIVNRQIAYF